MTIQTGRSIVNDVNRQICLFTAADKRLPLSGSRREPFRSLDMGYALSGKTALVTGANRGIGEAIVDALVAAGVKKVYAAARPATAVASCPSGSM